MFDKYLNYTTEILEQVEVHERNTISNNLVLHLLMYMTIIVD